MPDLCPICNEKSNNSRNDYEQLTLVTCSNCGKFCISDMAKPLASDSKSKAILSHIIWKMNQSSQPPSIKRELAENILASHSMPSHVEQSNNLIRFVGDELDRLGRPGGVVCRHRGAFRAPVGVVEQEDLRFIYDHLQESQLLRVNPNYRAKVNGEEVTGTGISLTFKGWDEYKRLRNSAADSRKAFMAMQYGDDILDEMYSECFKPAIGLTGFELQRLDETPKAGILDNHMRVEIRTSRFILADLTHNNRGAYWEAGFAEGLDKPVIFLCEESVFNSTDPKIRPHFDANHSQAVVWRREEKEMAGEALKNVIRATLPGEAKMED